MTHADRHGHTHRLELTDATVREWAATVLTADPETGIVLDRSAFYPGGGGQPPDQGVLLWGGVRTRIVGTRKGDELYLLLLGEANGITSKRDPRLDQVAELLLNGENGQGGLLLGKGVVFEREARDDPVADGKMTAARFGTGRLLGNQQASPGDLLL